MIDQRKYEQIRNMVRGQMPHQITSKENLRFFIRKITGTPMQLNRPLGGSLISGDLSDREMDEVVDRLFRELGLRESKGDNDDYRRLLYKLSRAFPSGNVTMSQIRQFVAANWQGTLPAREVVQLLANEPQFQQSNVGGPVARSSAGGMVPDFKPRNPINESLERYEEFKRLVKEGKRTSYRIGEVQPTVSHDDAARVEEPASVAREQLRESQQRQRQIDYLRSGVRQGSISAEDTASGIRAILTHREQAAPAVDRGTAEQWAEYRMTEGRYAGMKLGEIPDAYWHKYLANRNPRRALPWHVKQYLENRSGMLLGGSRQLPSIDPATGQVTRQEVGRNDYLGHESTRFSDQDIFSPMDLGGRLEPMSEGFGVSDTFDRPPIVQVDWRTGRKFESPDWGRRKYAYRRVKQYDPEYYESKERGDLNQMMYGRRNAKPRQMPTWFWNKFLRDNPYFAAVFENQDQFPLQKKMKWYRDKYTGERRRIWTGQYEHPLAPQMMMARKMAGELWAEQYEMLDLDRWRQKEMAANKWEYMRAGVAGSMAFRDDEIAPYEGPSRSARRDVTQYPELTDAELEDRQTLREMFGSRSGYDPSERGMNTAEGGGNPYGQGWIRELYEAGQQGKQVLDAKAQEILETLQDADEEVMDQFQEIYTGMLLWNQNQGLQRQP